MKAKYWVIGLLALILNIGCKESPTSAKAIVHDYFPLQIGNTWIYGEVSDSGQVSHRDTVKVVTTASLSGKTYFAVESRRAGIVDTLYLREDTAGRVFSYSPIVLSEALFLDPTLPAGSKWYASDTSFIDSVVSINGTVTVPAGRFAPAIVLLERCLQCATASLGDPAIYAENVGLVRQFQDYELLSAIVGTRTYP